MSQPIKQLGFTLVELMVTLAISVVILAGVVNIYINSLTQSKVTGNLASMQESGRFALEILSRDIRMAGYAGCLGYDQVEGSENAYLLYNRAAANNSLLGIVGNEWAGSGYASTTLAPMVTDSTARLGTAGGGWLTSGGAALVENYSEAIANSDVVQVWTTAELAVGVEKFDPQAAQIDITVRKGHGLSAGDVVMFTGCGYIFVGQICSAADERVTISQGGSATCNNNFSSYNVAQLNSDVGAVVEGLEAFTFRDAVYFVGKRDSGKATPPSLYRGVNGVAREMVEGVENMQILYGVDTLHDSRELRTADKYVTADQVMNRWSDVVAVRVSVLIRSFEKDVAGGSYEFNFNGRKYTAQDGYLRQAYSTTIALRNRNGGNVQGLVTP